MTDDPDKLRNRLIKILKVQNQPVPVSEVTSSVTLPGGATQLEMQIDGIEATYMRPNTKASCPAVLYFHAHGGDYATGRRELLNGARWLSAPYADDLLAAGYAVLALDMPGFGDRQTEGSESALSKAFLWRGQSLYGSMIETGKRGLDWLVAQPDIEVDRLVTLGMSMGAAHAYWLGALDQRVSAVVQLCVLADMEPMIGQGDHDRHGPYLTVPGMLAHCDMGDVAGLIAPRPQFIAHGETDHLTPSTAREAAMDKVRSAYGVQPKALTEFMARDSGHVETAEMRFSVLDFLRGLLR